MLNLIRFEPGAEVPLHSHDHEQLGLVLEGMQASLVDGVAHELGPLRDTYSRVASSTRRIAGRKEPLFSTSSGPSARTTENAGRRASGRR